jgi:integron integrase
MGTNALRPYRVSPPGVLAGTLVVRETGPGGAPKPRLLDRVRHAISARHYSRRTEKAYVHWIKRYIFFHAKRHPAEMSAPEVTAFLTSLAVKGKVAASTQNQALSALLFLYREVLGVDLPWLEGLVRAKPPQRLPVVLTREEVRTVLGKLDGVPRLMALLLYGAGLRLLECCRLRVHDVDFAANQIAIRDGKGNKDRLTMLPAAIKTDLAAHIAHAHEQHHADLRQGAGWVELPWALARKYPNAGREWGWQWVFPATRIYVDRLTGQRRRHHLHESVLQRAVKDAVRHAGMPSEPRATRSATPSRPICSRTAMTSVPCRNSSAITTSARRRSTPTSSTEARPASGARPIECSCRDVRAVPALRWARPGAELQGHAG